MTGYRHNFQTFLREHQVAGTMELQRGSLGGPLDGNGVWEAHGSVTLEGGQFLPSPGQPLITNVSGSVTYAPSLVQISHAQRQHRTFNCFSPGSHP